MQMGTTTTIQVFTNVILNYDDWYVIYNWTSECVYDWWYDNGYVQTNHSIIQSMHTEVNYCWCSLS